MKYYKTFYNPTFNVKIYFKNLVGSFWFHINHYMYIFPLKKYKVDSWLTIFVQNTQCSETQMLSGKYLSFEGKVYKEGMSEG